MPFSKIRPWGNVNGSKLLLNDSLIEYKLVNLHE